MVQRLVGLVADPTFALVYDALPSNEGRASLIDALIRSFNLHNECILVPPSHASKSELCKYHDDDFIAFLLGVDEDCENSIGYLSDSTASETAEKSPYEVYGLQDDCPAFPLLPQYVTAVAGGTIACARFLTSQRQSSIAINWHGGRHHAQKSRCAGFCYVNDCVLGILELRKRYEKILYIDLDIHHGDGVEKAFLKSSKVLTLSFHYAGVGFYPGTGKEVCVREGTGRGWAYALNAPYERNLSCLDSALKICVAAFDSFLPDAIVILCGADGLARDRASEWNLNAKGFEKLIQRILRFTKPTLLLGGGGYNHQDTARLQTLLTHVAIHDTFLEEEYIPDHEFSEQYKDDLYQMRIDRLPRVDENTVESVGLLEEKILRCLAAIPSS